MVTAHQVFNVCRLFGGGHVLQAELVVAIQNIGMLVAHTHAGASGCRAAHVVCSHADFGLAVFDDIDARIYQAGGRTRRKVNGHLFGRVLVGQCDGCHQVFGVYWPAFMQGWQTGTQVADVVRAVACTDDVGELAFHDTQRHFAITDSLFGCADLHDGIAGFCVGRSQCRCRLGNFVKAALLSGVAGQQALDGVFSKETVALDAVTFNIKLRFGYRNVALALVG